MALVTPSENVKTFYEVKICARGVKNRCRKSDFHLFDLVSHAVVNAKDCPELIAALKDNAKAILSRHMKRTDSAWLSFTYAEDDGSGFVSLHIMSPKNFKIEL